MMDAPTHDHGWSAITDDDDIRLDVEDPYVAGVPSGYYGTVVEVDRHDAGDPRRVTIDTRDHGTVYAYWHGAIKDDPDADHRIGRHRGDVLRIRTGGEKGAVAG